MPRYFLKNPTKPQDILVKQGQSWDEPIYRGRDSNDYFILKLGKDLRRYLVPFDPETATLSTPVTVVSDDWTGEPQILAMAQDDWNDVLTEADRGDPNAEHVVEEILRRLLDGDILRLTRDGATTGRLLARRQNGHWTIVSER